ncbi:acyl carrier protein phosphodiesterase [Marinobacter sp. OP 3.4]|uniref:acyl carrier protein phosphodiesterase n=1 Tax=Marinobacter sp. OP 3.4 TaxID=3076501 RepID=UPI002E2108D7
MNHFCHLFLARPTVESRVGNLLGDFARGLDSRDLPEQVREGLEHHRAVDAFTDSHPEVLASKACFSAGRRRFAGIALDILFDHYLLRHWDRFGHTDKDNFISELYADLEAGHHLMPPSMEQVTRRMVAYDWFKAYEDLETVGQAMDRVASRIRFRHGFAGVIDEIRPMDDELEARFLAFFPDLLAFSRSRLDP